MTTVSRNKKAATVAQLQAQVLELAFKTTERIFNCAIPPDWGRAWLEAFRRYEKQEKQARKLLTDFSKNDEATRGQWRAVRRFLQGEGLDPAHFDLGRDYGARADLSPTTRWLLDAWVPVEGSDLPKNPDEPPQGEFVNEVATPVEAAKFDHERWGGLPQQSWTGFLLLHFGRLHNPQFKSPDYAAEVAKMKGRWVAGRWEWRMPEVARPPVGGPPQWLFPSDPELASISVVIFSKVFAKLGITLVMKDDPMNRMSPEKVLDRHRRPIGRARRDKEAEEQATLFFEDVPSPPTSSRGIAKSGYTPLLPWPERFAGKSLAVLADAAP